jgi:hypothetical protein
MLWHCKCYIASDLHDMMKASFANLIRGDDIAVVALHGIPGRMDIEELDQAVKHLFSQFLPLFIQAFFVFLHREADHGI